MSEPRYRFESRVATGGMGEVWRATDTVLGREVAVKVLKPEYADDATFRSRFQTEARHAAALHHPNVASVFDYGELPAEDGSGIPRPYLVMELVPGQPLSALLHEGRPMPPDTAVDLVAQACDGVAAAHAIGVVHRDMKPGNLLVTRDGHVKITDFGIARAADAAGLTQTGQVIGTPAYLSPEQAEGRTATAASDVYSLGVMLYECLAGRRPFVGDSAIGTAMAHLRQQPPPLSEDIPVRLREAVGVALAKDPAARFASAADFAAVLRGGPVPPGLAVAGLGTAGLPAAAAGTTQVLGAPDPVPAGGVPAPPEDEHRRRRPGWVPWAVAAVVLLLVLVAAALSGNDEPPPAPGDEPSTRSTAGASPTPTETPTRTSRPSPSPTPSRTRAPSPTPSPSPSPSPSPTPSPSPSPTEEAGFEVVAADFIGRNADDVETELEAEGLDVDQESVSNTVGAPEDTVADVTPTGLVPVGETVTLLVYEEPVAPEEDEEGEQPPAPADPGSGPPEDAGGGGPEAQRQGKGAGSKGKGP